MKRLGLRGLQGQTWPTRKNKIWDLSPSLPTTKFIRFKFHFLYKNKRWIALFHQALRWQWGTALKIIICKYTVQLFHRNIFSKANNCWIPHQERWSRLFFKVVVSQKGCAIKWSLCSVLSALPKFLLHLFSRDAGYKDPFLTSPKPHDMHPIPDRKSAP